MIEEFGQIKKVNVGQETFKIILKMIMSGKWKQGEKIPSENEFKDMLGVSRHTVRSALNNLQMLGMVETRQGDGNYIKFIGIGLYMDFLIPYLFINEENINTIMEFREGIESITARYAALRATPEEIADLEKKLEKCNKVTNNVKEYLTADFNFHYAIAKMTKNDLLIQSMYVVKKYCYEALVKYVDKAISIDGTRRHRGILKAIQEHDPDAAEDHMNKHILKVIEMINK